MTTRTSDLHIFVRNGEIDTERNEDGELRLKFGNHTVTLRDKETEKQLLKKVGVL